MTSTDAPAFSIHSVRERAAGAKPNRIRPLHGSNVCRIVDSKTQDGIWGFDGGLDFIEAHLETIEQAIQQRAYDGQWSCQIAIPFAGERARHGITDGLNRALPGFEIEIVDDRCVSISWESDPAEFSRLRGVTFVAAGGASGEEGMDVAGWQVRFLDGTWSRSLYGEGEARSIMSSPRGTVTEIRPAYASPSGERDPRLKLSDAVGTT